MDILPGKRFNLWLPEEEDWEQLYEVLEGMYLLLRTEKHSNIREGYVG